MEYLVQQQFFAMFKTRAAVFQSDLKLMCHETSYKKHYLVKYSGYLCAICHTFI